MGMISYADDANGHIVKITVHPDGATQVDWNTALLGWKYAYAGTGAQNSFAGGGFSSYLQGPESVTQCTTMTKEDPPKSNYAYAIAEYMYSGNWSSGDNVQKDIGNIPVRVASNRKYHNIAAARQPSATVIIADSGYYYTNAKYKSNYTPKSFKHNEAESDAAVMLRHTGKANALFIDGHVGSLDKGDSARPPTSSPTCSAMMESPNKMPKKTVLKQFGIAAAVLTAAVAAAAAPLSPSRIDTGRLRWRTMPGVRADGNRVEARIPAGSPEISRRNCAETDVPLKAFWNRELGFSVRIRGKNVTPPQQEWLNGVKFLLYFKQPDGGGHWVEAETRTGDFDWKTFSFSEWIPAGSSDGILYLGLEKCSGEAEFDLASLEIAPLGEDEETPQPLDSALIRELDLIENRMREGMTNSGTAPAEKIRSTLARQRADGSFDDIDYADDNRSAWKTAEHLSRARMLARAWAVGNSGFHRNPEIGKAVQKAVAWWAQNRPYNPNWWWNDMSVPQTMGETLLLAPELFPAGPERDAALRVCRQAKFLPRYTGNNRVFAARNIFLRALLERNIAPLDRAAAALSEEIRLAPVANKTKWGFGGIRADGCYHQHGPQVQFGNYGGEFLENVAYWSNIWKGTRWQLTPEQWEVMRHLSFDGFQWTLWNGRMEMLAIGRHLGYDMPKIKGKWVLGSLAKLRAADPGDKVPYDAVLKRNEDKVNTLVGNRHFWNSDMMIHRRPDWFAAVRMNSVRVHPIEDETNWDNALGRYFSDGVCLVTRTGNEYDNITAVWDWTRLPGTTLPATPILDTGECEKIGLRLCGRFPRWTYSRNGGRALGETTFVGGVTDGVRGAAVFTMDLDGVKAKKAYFFDTDAVYQLGTGISSTVPYEVATTVNSCIRNGEIKQGENWFHHDGIGYRGGNMKLTAGERTGDWRILEGGRVEPKPETKDLFHLQIDHGVRPRNASYSFAILPGATPEETAKWSKGKVLANNETVQAVEFNNGAIGAIFHAPGKLGNFETRAPGAFLIEGKKVFVADPSAKLKEITIALDGKPKTVKLPDGEMEGSSVRVDFAGRP